VNKQGPLKILIAEDEEESRLLLQKYLTPCGSCELASNGEEALRAFEKAHEKKAPFDLICLDILMPGLDGHEVLRKIRDRESAFGIPLHSRYAAVVFMATAKREADHFIQALRDECDAYLIKPIRKKYLYRNLRERGLLGPEIKGET
jgi:two-component system chemotaxis response regulator CheY